MSGELTQFKKGQIPWNKGLKGIHLSPHSEFKKGSIPINKKEHLQKECPECEKEFFVKVCLERVICCSISCSVKKRIREKGHPNWIADRNQLKKGRIHAYDYAYRCWSKSVKNRDGWKCKISNGDCSGRMEAHHILSWKSHPELRYEINNGITLCHAHHPRGEAAEKRLSPYFQELVSASSEII